MKHYPNDTLILDDLLQDANRHLQQLNYIVKELDVRGAAGSFIAIARSCQPLYAVLVSRRLAQVEKERKGCGHCSCTCVGCAPCGETENL